ncbi:hypothetical protein CEQ15_11460 [Chryseobacterium indologenes]|uniref:hypothetical protein n=1 Tax=Chryseobacterium indologenes TaxID=253 RepID=UPI000B51D191|nr:hypothetical protein [Chryseobacterium indologenes]ASE62065.1 hypothetical protein CEQ15_11460 [Chryseobacterium indologenes]
MTISENDYLLTLNYFKKTLDKGDKYLAYGDWIELCTLEDLKTLPTFQTNYEATEYCFENTTDRDYVIQLSVEWAYKAMVAGIEDPSIIVRKGGLINVKMTAFYYADKVENELTKTKKKENRNEKNSPKEKTVEHVRPFGKEDPGTRQKDKQDKDISDQKKIRKPEWKKGRFRH